MDTKDWTTGKGKDGLKNRIVKKSLIERLKSMGFSDKKIEFIFSESSNKPNSSSSTEGDK